MTIRKHRWPVKVFVRSFHTLLCILIPASLIRDETSDLHVAIFNDGNWWYPSLYFGVLISSLVLYHVTCCLDPGYVPVESRMLMFTNMAEIFFAMLSFNGGRNQLSPSPSSSDEETSISVEADNDVIDNDVADDSQSLIRSRKKRGVKKTCGFCDIVQPIRAKHCHDCGRCVRRFDHHCPWLETCIAERTHRYFLIFLGLTSATIVWSFKLVWSALSYKETWYEWVESNWPLLLDLFVLIVGGFTTILLFIFHSHLMCTNATTWEVVSRERISYLKHLDMEYNPFHEGYCKNAFVFLCSCSPKNWDKIYFRRASDSTRTV